jgi:hypothetical protein
MPPKTLTKSRENLQALFKNREELAKYQSYDIVINYVWSRLESIMHGRVPYQTQYIINVNVLEQHTRLASSQEFLTEVIDLLKKEYPGVDFTYKETAGYDGKIIERIIIMDWS